MSVEPIRVVILGGGPAALTAAWELTDPKQNNAYDVTVYQLGWRLGGKCASGRNRESHDRIEEHGLHLFFGYYDNAFEILGGVYEELASQGNQKYKTIYDALVPSQNVTLCELDGSGWDTWSVKIPDLPGLPGKGQPPDMWQAFLHCLNIISHVFSRFPIGHPEGKKTAHGAEPHWWNRLAGIPFAKIDHLFASGGRAAFSIAKAFAESLVSPHQQNDQERHSRLISLLEEAWQSIEHLWEKDGFDTWWCELEKDLRRLYIILDLAFTVGLGALRSGFFFDHHKAVAKLNQLNFRTWLKEQGAKQVTIDSAMVRALYDLTFAYPDGDHNSQGDLAAGSTVAGLFNMVLYQGSFLWKMRAGTGDIIAAPLYKALLSRGVRFEFFSKVTDLVPSMFQDQIETVKISRQVQLNDPEYHPLFNCKGLDCWPSEPDYSQIVEGKKLKKEKIDLESHWTKWVDTGKPIELQYGEDFDVIVLGIPVGALGDICPQIIKQKAEWRAMVQNVKTVQTQSIQLLFNGNGNSLGTLPVGTVIGASDSSPLDAAADISEVLVAETWPDGGPKHLSILSGAMPGPGAAPPKSAHDYPKEAQSMVMDTTMEFCDTGAPVLWPKIADANGFDWNALWAASGQDGSQRLASQYMRANIDPGQRYTLSVAGSAAHRLRTDESGYYNLYLTGDWTDNPGNLGGFESTVMSGRLASRAISGFPKRIARVPNDSTYYNMRAPYKNPHELPVFVEYDGMQTFPGPFSFKNVKMWSFFLQGDYAKLQALAKRIFNTPSNNAVSYVPLSKMIMMTFMDITDASSRYNTQVTGAYEREVAFWVFLGREETPGSRNIVNLGGFTPFLIINNPLGYIEGRDVWGYMKQQGHVKLPSADPPSSEFVVDAYGVANNPFTEPWKYRHLLTVKPVAGSKPAKGTAWKGLEAGVKEIKKALFDGQPGLEPTWQFADNLLEDFLQKKMRQVFLKQFRDVADPERACYQAITEASMKVSSVQGITIEQPHEMIVEDLFNTALVDTLGISPRINLPFGLHFTMDMSLENGKVLWKAGGET